MLDPGVAKALAAAAEPARETQAPHEHKFCWTGGTVTRCDCGEIKVTASFYASEGGATARTPCGDMMHNGTYDAALEAVMNEDGPPDETMAIYNNAQLSRLAVQWLYEDDAWTHMPAFGTGLIRELARRLNVANAKPEEF